MSKRVSSVKKRAPVVMKKRGTGNEARSAERPSEPVQLRRYLVNGKPSSKGEFAGQPFIVAGAGLPEEGTAYGFSQEDLFCRWAAGTRHAADFARAMGR